MKVLPQVTATGNICIITIIYIWNLLQCLFYITGISQQNEKLQKNKSAYPEGNHRRKVKRTDTGTNTNWFFNAESINSICHIGNILSHLQCRHPTSMFHHLYTTQIKICRELHQKKPRAQSLSHHNNFSSNIFKKTHLNHGRHRLVRPLTSFLVRWSHWWQVYPKTITSY